MIGYRRSPRALSALPLATDCWWRLYWPFLIGWTIRGIAFVTSWNKNASLFISFASFARVSFVLEEGAGLWGPGASEEEGKGREGGGEGETSSVGVSSGDYPDTRGNAGVFQYWFWQRQNIWRLHLSGKKNIYIYTHPSLPFLHTKSYFLIYVDVFCTLRWQQVRGSNGVTKRSNC